MFCRVCGHDNGDRGKGKCAKCGFDLEYMNLPLGEQRKNLQHPMEQPADQGDNSFRLYTHKKTGLFGVSLGIVGILAAIFIITTFERVEVQSETSTFDNTTEPVEDVISDSLPLRIGADIVYVLNDSGTSAEPRTNLNLALIPEGSSVAFIGSRSVPIRPLVNFIDRKRAEGAQARLDLNAVCCWDDSTETGFTRIPLFVETSTEDSASRPVLVKLIFTGEWIDGRVEEFSIDIPSPNPGGQYNQYKLDSVLTQVSRRLAGRELGVRPVAVIAMFSEDLDLGQAVDMMQRIHPSVDSLGWEGLGLRYFVLER
jgi:hypothetical protein